jgi:hypothetical protein
MPTPNFKFLEAVQQLEFRLVCIIVYVLGAQGGGGISLNLCTRTIRYRQCGISRGLRRAHAGVVVVGPHAPDG